MTSFQRLSRIFPQNAITRAERDYQQRSARVFSPFRRKVNRFVRWFMIMIAILQFGGLLIASLMQRNPIPLIESLQPLPTLVILPFILYHFYLMFQTLSIAARSISREKEGQTWDMLVLTGIDARKIVRSKWRATLQHQFPAYSLLALLHFGMIAAAALNPFTWASSRGVPNYQIDVKLPHPFTLLYVALFGFGFTVINLCFSAACGVMASAASRNDRVAFIRAIFNQIAISILVAFVVLWSANQLYLNQIIENRNLYAGIGVVGLSLGDNGFIAGISSIGPFKDEYNQFDPSMIKPISLEFFIISAAGIIAYLPLIWFVLRRAESNAIRAAALPVKKSSFFHRVRRSLVTPSS